MFYTITAPRPCGPSPIIYNYDPSTNWDEENPFCPWVDEWTTEFEAMKYLKTTYKFEEIQKDYK